jgi:hypothetical protein
MFKDKKRIIFFALVILSLFSLLWIIFMTRGKPSNTPSPAPTTKFELIKTIPLNNSTDPLLSTSAIEFYFSKPIKVESLVINTNPNVNIIFELNQNNTILYVRAEEGWQYGTLYELIVSAVSKDNEELPGKIVLKFKPATLKNSPLDEIPQ